MDVSEILNVVFGGGLVAALTALCTMGPTIRKAKAEAERATADAEQQRFNNADHATRILMENIVEPLKKELSATRREMARLRKAIDGASSCEHRNDCPVIDIMRQSPNGDDAAGRDKGHGKGEPSGGPDPGAGAAVGGGNPAFAGPTV